MKQLVLQYKQTSTDAWQTTPLTADVLSCRVYVLPNTETKDSEFRRASGRKCSTKTPRLYADIVVSPTMFDPAITTAGDSNWVYIQRWYCAPIMQIIYKPTIDYPSLDTVTALTASDNAIYWNISDVQPIFEQADKPDRKLRYVEINLESVDKYQM